MNNKLLTAGLAIILTVAVLFLSSCENSSKSDLLLNDKNEYMLKGYIKSAQKQNIDTAMIEEDVSRWCSYNSAKESYDNMSQYKVVVCLSSETKGSGHMLSYALSPGTRFVGAADAGRDSIVGNPDIKGLVVEPYLDNTPVCVSDKKGWQEFSVTVWIDESVEKISEIHLEIQSVICFYNENGEEVTSGWSIITPIEYRMK